MLPCLLLLGGLFYTIEIPCRSSWSLSIAIVSLLIKVDLIDAKAHHPELIQNERSVESKRNVDVPFYSRSSAFYNLPPPISTAADEG